MTSLVDYSNLEQQRKAVTTTDSPIEGVPTAQRVRLINSIQTELLVQSFKDRILVILTQLGRIGCLIQVLPPPSTLPTALPTLSSSPSTSTSISSLPLPHPSLIVSPLFGVSPTRHISALHDLYATQISTILFEKMNRDSLGIEIKPVVLGIGLKWNSQSQQQEGEGEGEGEGMISETEKDTFMQVMEMVKECIA